MVRDWGLKQSRPASPQLTSVGGSTGCRPAPPGATRATAVVSGSDHGTFDAALSRPHNRHDGAGTRNGLVIGVTCAVRGGACGAGWGGGGAGPGADGWPIGIAIRRKAGSDF